MAASICPHKVLAFGLESPSIAAVQGIVARGLAKSYGPVRALDGVDLDVPAGRVAALVGQNGAGKTTLIKILATTVLPDEGTASVGGWDVVRCPELARAAVGLYLGDERSFYWRLTGLQNLEFFAALRGMRGEQAVAKALEALEAVQLGEAARTRVDRYSSGMRARLGVARALLGEPAALLLDEPTKSIDPVTAMSIRTLVKQVAVGRGLAVLFSTHDLHEAATLAEEIVLLARGRVAATVRGGGDPTTLEQMLVEAST